MKKEEIQEFIAKTLAGLEEPLADELKSMGFSEVTPLRRAVSFKTDFKGMIRANLNSRLSLSILMPLTTYRFKDKEGLYKGAAKIDWDRFFMLNKTFLVRSTVYSKLFNNSAYPGLIVKDAIADVFRKRLGKRPSIDKERPDVIVDVYINENECSISLNSSGDPLYMRGYRNMTFPAPLNEVLAAGMIALSGWTPEEDFINPMCGSGTLSVEAAMMAKKVHPQKLRKHFAFQNWKMFDTSEMQEIRDDLIKKELNKMPVKVIASDKSSRAVAITRNSLSILGMTDDVELLKMNFFKPKISTKKGFVVINPPYGERMEEDDILEYYNEIGQTFKHRYDGHTAAVISSNLEAIQKIGLKPIAKFDLFNGKIPCKFLIYDLYQGSKKDLGNS